jgi:uncharacterized protein YijF (DUF1287 family)
MFDIFRRVNKLESDMRRLQGKLRLKDYRVGDIVKYTTTEGEVHASVIEVSIDYFAGEYVKLMNSNFDTLIVFKTCELILISKEDICSD